MALILTFFYYPSQPKFAAMKESQENILKLLILCLIYLFTAL